MNERILIVGRDSHPSGLPDRLESEGYTVLTVADGRGCAKALMEGAFDLALIGHPLPDMSGIDLLKRIASEHPDLPVMVLSAEDDVDSAVKAMKLGALEYVRRPFDPEEVVYLIKRALETTMLRREVRDLRSGLRERLGISSIVCSSRSMRRICELVRKVAGSGATTILLQGESGTGKGLVASAIHYESDRAERPFMVITAAALPEPLLESELFGHEQGAFTDARSAKKGLLELADGGTVFLDEIADVSPNIQAKLLRFMEDKRFKRVGGTRDIEVDVRIIAATNRDLKAAVRRGQFRADLYYRLNVVPIHLPPLRERREDIPLLADAFIRRFNREFNKSVRGFTREAMEVLVAHDWPGNVRELRNLVERAVLLASGDILTEADLPAEMRTSAAERRSGFIALPPDGLDLAALERSLVLQALERTGGNRTHAAALLGMTRDQIRYRLKKYGISPEGTDGRTVLRGAGDGRETE